MAGGRRGTISMMYEVLMSLILLALFITTTLLYINARATGAAYWSQVYAEDLATTSDTVNAAYGDVLLRYDNLKTNLDLTFWTNTNGTVGVGVLPSPQYGISTRGITETLSFAMPPDTPASFYGRAEEFPKPGMFTNPSFLALRKIGSAFAITEAEFALSSCPTVQPSVELQHANVYLDAPDAVLEAFVDVLADTAIHVVTEDAATITITVEKTASDANTMAFTNTNADGMALACLFRQRLELLSLETFTVSGPSSSGTQFSLGIALETTASDTDIGRALAFALAEIYASPQGDVETTLVEFHEEEPAEETPEVCPVQIVPWAGTDPYRQADIWEGTVPELQEAYEAFNEAVGREQHIISTWRPPEYQEHIRSVWDAWRFVQGKPITINDPTCPNHGQTIQPPEGWENCGELKAELEKDNGELDRHAARLDTRPACSSEHTRGVAIDITPPSVGDDEYMEWIQIANSLPGDLELCHYIAGDEPHFALTAHLPGGTPCLVA